MERKPLEFVKSGDVLKATDGSITVREVSNKETNTRKYYIDGIEGNKTLLVSVDKNGRPYIAKVDALNK